MFIIAVHLITIFHVCTIVMSCHQCCHFVTLSGFFLFDLHYF